MRYTAAVAFLLFFTEIAGAYNQVMSYQSRYGTASGAVHVTLNECRYINNQSPEIEGMIKNDLGAEVFARLPTAISDYLNLGISPRTLIFPAAKHTHFYDPRFVKEVKDQVELSGHLDAFYFFMDLQKAQEGARLNGKTVPATREDFATSLASRYRLIFPISFSKKVDDTLTPGFIAYLVGRQIDDTSFLLELGKGGNIQISPLVMVDILTNGFGQHQGVLDLLASLDLQDARYLGIVLSVELYLPEPSSEPADQF